MEGKSNFGAFKVPFTTSLAIVLVVDIAYHIGGHPVPRRDIARRQGISGTSFLHIIYLLRRANIVFGTNKGTKRYQGFRLARHRSRITLGDIVRAVPGAPATNAAKIPTSDLIDAAINPVLITLMTDIMARLDSITIEDLCRSAKEAGIVSEGKADFDIME